MHALSEHFWGIKNQAKPNGQQGVKRKTKPDEEKSFPSITPQLEEQWDGSQSQPPFISNPILTHSLTHFLSCFLRSLLEPTKKDYKRTRDHMPTFHSLVLPLHVRSQGGKNRQKIGSIKSVIIVHPVRALLKMKKVEKNQRA